MDTVAVAVLSVEGRMAVAAGTVALAEAGTECVGALGPVVVRATVVGLTSPVVGGEIAGGVVPPVVFGRGEHHAVS